MIRIQKNPVADTRTCDFAHVTKDQLRVASYAHICDVRAGLMLFRQLLNRAGEVHDRDKLTDLDSFHADFLTGFVQTGWWDRHRKLNRHHLLSADGIPADVNLIDVLDFITDLVMSRAARGADFPIALPHDVLVKAFENTVELLKAEVEVIP